MLQGALGPLRQGPIFDAFKERVILRSLAAATNIAGGFGLIIHKHFLNGRKIAFTIAVLLLTLPCHGQIRPGGG